MELARIQSKIFEIRGLKVMLDFDLAEMYQVETKSLNLSVKRNMKRFPFDFMFQLTKDEWDNLRLQIETSKRGGYQDAKLVSWTIVNRAWGDLSCNVYEISEEK